MACHIRAERGDIFPIYRESLLFQLTQDTGLIYHVVENYGIGHQVVVLDDLLLLLGVVVRDDPFPTEEQPFGEAVVGFYLVGRRCDLLAVDDVF